MFFGFFVRLVFFFFFLLQTNPFFFCRRFPHSHTHAHPPSLSFSSLSLSFALSPPRSSTLPLQEEETETSKQKEESKNKTKQKKEEQKKVESTTPHLPNDFTKKTKKDRKMENPKEKKKSKTFNRLDERFQLKPEHEPNHIFDEEKEMIKELRQNPLFDSLDDKTLAVFLFARRHDIGAVKELLKKHVDVKIKYGFDKELPKWEEVQSVMGKSNVRINGAYDIYARNVYYYFIEHDLPKDRDPVNFWKFAFWDCYDMIKSEPLNILRNGSIFVVDMQNFGWKNVDLSRSELLFFFFFLPSFSPQCGSRFVFFFLTHPTVRAENSAAR
jgi:hypothetical protein